MSQGSAVELLELVALMDAGAFRHSLLQAQYHFLGCSHHDEAQRPPKIMRSAPLTWKLKALAPPPLR